MVTAAWFLQLAVSAAECGFLPSMRRRHASCPSTPIQVDGSMDAGSSFSAMEWLLERRVTSCDPRATTHQLGPGLRRNVSSRSGSSPHGGRDEHEYAGVGRYGRNEDGRRGPAGECAEWRHDAAYGSD